jgi:hypothetical protein
MPVGRMAAFAVAALLISAETSGSVSAQTAAAPSPATRTVSCETPVFAPDSSHARLTAFFGAENVEISRKEAADGEPPEARSIVYPRDPKNRLEVLWFDHKALEGVSEINFEEPSLWVWPNGMRAGMTLSEVESATKGPFSIVVAEAESDKWGHVFIGVYTFNNRLPGLCHMSLFLKPNKILTRRQKDDISGIFKSIDQSLRDADMQAFAVSITYSR